MAETETMTPGRAAAMWWAERIGAPVHKATTMTADDPDRAHGEFVFMAMQIVAGRHPLSDGQGDTFVAALAPVIDQMLTRVDWVSLGVDYGPDLELANAAKVAGIHPSRFPFKTHMSVTPMYVTAALGYGAQARLIWQHDDWIRPSCGSLRYEERGRGDYLWLEEVCGMPRFHDAEHGDWKPDTASCATCGKTQAVHWNSNDHSHTFSRGEVAA
jgi:hypothetical protein